MSAPVDTPLPRRFVCLGECMVELAQTADGTYRRGFAGDTFNAAWYARRAFGAGWTVGYASCIGDDALSEEMAAFMAAQDIDTTGLRRVAGRTPGLYMISLDAGERSFAYWRDTSPARLLAEDAPWLAATLRAARHVHVSGITLAILPPAGRDRLVDALARARTAGTTVSFDTNIRRRLWDDDATLREALRRAAAVSDIVLPSFDEERDVFGDADPAATAERYQADGPRAVVVKDGPGAVLWRAASGETALIPVEPVFPVVDTTAAGDSFAGTFLAHWLQGTPAPEAIRAAAHVAGRVIQAHGALIEDAG